MPKRLATLSLMQDDDGTMRLIIDEAKALTRKDNQPARVIAAHIVDAAMLFATTWGKR